MGNLQGEFSADSRVGAMFGTMALVARCRRFIHGFPCQLSKICYSSRERKRQRTCGTTRKGVRHHSVRELLSRREQCRCGAVGSDTGARDALARGCSRPRVCMDQTNRKSYAL